MGEINGDMKQHSINKKKKRKEKQKKREREQRADGTNRKQVKSWFI